MKKSDIEFARRVVKMYGVWKGMNSRCSNKKRKGYHRYGGRGIKVCARWRDFFNFLSDMGFPDAGQSLERKDNDGDYSPQNCMWADRATQAQNRSTNRVITVNGQRLRIFEAAELYGVSHKLIRGRIDRLSWSESSAATVRPGSVQERILMVRGRPISLTRAAKRAGISLKTVSHRIDVLGWPHTKAATQPARKMRAART